MMEYRKSLLVSTGCRARKEIAVLPGSKTPTVHAATGNTDNRVGGKWKTAAHPTSEFPMRPSTRPTDRPCACMSEYALFLSSARPDMQGVSAASIAFPF